MLLGVDRGGGDAQALRASGHRRVVDGLNVNAVVVQKDAAGRLTLLSLSYQHRGDVADGAHDRKPRFEQASLCVVNGGGTVTRGGR